MNSRLFVIVLFFGAFVADMNAVMLAPLLVVAGGRVAASPLVTPSVVSG
jgi:hypothetical protein